MKKVICLSGPSGAGKTHARTHDPKLMKYPQIDIADIYLEIGPYWHVAMDTLFSRVEELMITHNTVVIEGYFSRNSPSRRWLEGWGEMRGYKVVYKEYNAPYEIRAKRVHDQYIQMIAKAVTEEEFTRAQRFANARKELLEIVK